MATHSSVLAGESQRWGRLVGCHLWGHTELDTTEVTQQQQQCLPQAADLAEGLVSDHLFQPLPCYSHHKTIVQIWLLFPQQQPVHPIPRFWLPIPPKGPRAPWRKWQILGMGQEIHKMKLKHLVMPESKTVLKKKKKKKSQNDGACQRDAGAKEKSSQ